MYYFGLRIKIPLLNCMSGLQYYNYFTLLYHHSVVKVSAVWPHIWNRFSVVQSEGYADPEYLEDLQESYLVIPDNYLPRTSITGSDNRYIARR
jgi:hypothetical protein